MQNIRSTYETPSIKEKQKRFIKQKFKPSADVFKVLTFLRKLAKLNCCDLEGD